jgi:catalase
MNARDTPRPYPPDAQAAIRAIDETFGRHDGNRVVHAKGVLCRGTFVPTPAAARLTRAEHMQGANIPVTVRFSNGSGDPQADDRAPEALGMATKFYLPDGARTDIVALTLPCFFVRTPKDFPAFTRAAKRSVGGKPGPRFALYLATHREAFAAVRAALRFKPPVSYATCRYNAIHAFKWIAADGNEQFVRYSWIPTAGERSLPRGEAKRRSGDYLQDEISERLVREPIRFALHVQIAGPGDRTDDATSTWPEKRERVDAGTLELTELETGREQGGDTLVFDPTRVIDGIELSDDPLPRLRSQAYSISVERRSGLSRPAELD